MNMYKLRVLLLTAVALITAWHAKAQDVDIDQLTQSVSTYTANINEQPKDASYYGNYHRFNSNYPSLKYRSSLQVGAGAPGLVLAALYWSMEGVDEMSKPNYIDTFGEKLADARYYDTPTTTVPALSLEYHYSIKHWLGLGVKAVVGLQTSAKRHVGTNRLFRRNSRVVTTALVDIRFSWLHRNILSMYSSIGIGAMYVTSTSGYNETIPMYDNTWIGLQLGQRVYGYAEIGGGIGGVVRGGFGVRF